MKQSNWWMGRSLESYWLESTDRDDVGANLKAPEHDESGKENWRYSLFKLAQPGDLVFHYHKPQDAIIGASVVAGPWMAQPITWGARGTFARAKGVRPHARPGYVIPLTGFAKLAMPLTLETLREAKGSLQQMIVQLNAQYPNQTLYFPFELARRPVRPLQGYAFKLPSAFVFAFPELGAWGVPLAVTSAQETQATQVPPGTGGQGYNVDPMVRRAVELHAMERATAFFASEGHLVTDVSAVRPFDLLTTKGSVTLTVEVKGTTSGAASVFLTRNEVDHARQHPENAVLFILHSVRVRQDAGVVVAEGGELQIHLPWHIDSGTLEAMQFRYVPPSLKAPKQ